MKRVNCQRQFLFPEILSDKLWIFIPDTISQIRNCEVEVYMSVTLFIHLD